MESSLFVDLMARQLRLLDHQGGNARKRSWFLRHEPNGPEISLCALREPGLAPVQTANMRPDKEELLKCERAPEGLSSY